MYNPCCTTVKLSLHTVEYSDFHMVIILWLSRWIPRRCNRNRVKTGKRVNQCLKLLKFTPPCDVWLHSGVKMSVLVHKIKELDDMDVQCCWDALTLQLALAHYLVHVPLIISRTHRFVDAISSVTIRQCIMITFTRHYLIRKNTTAIYMYFGHTTTCAW